MTKGFASLTVVLVLAALAACQQRSVTNAPPSVSVGKTTVTSSSEADASCVGCHARQAEGWAASMHRHAFDSPDFQRSFRTEPKQFCVDCHAPTSKSSGVGCTDCHSADASHPTTHKNVATKACEGCHDFDAPGTHAILQSTAREKAQSPFAEMQCVGCHKPDTDHRFNITRNADLLRRALDVSRPAQIDEAKQTITVRIATKGVGHRFPTGDIYRRLTITLTAVDESSSLIAGETFHLHRDWDRHRLHLHMSDVPEPVVSEQDTRLSHVPREFTIAYRAADRRRPTRVHLTVNYERGASAEGTFFETFGEPLEIFDGDLPHN